MIKMITYRALLAAFHAGEAVHFARGGQTVSGQSGVRNESAACKGGYHPTTKGWSVRKSGFIKYSDNLINVAFIMSCKFKIPFPLLK